MPKQSLTTGMRHSGNKEKRQRSQVVSTETSDQDPGPSNATNDGYEEDLNKLSVKQLWEKIKVKS